MKGQTSRRVRAAGAALVFVVAAAIGLPHAKHTALAQAPQRTVAITVDDLPGAIPGTDKSMGDLQELERINRAIPSVLRAHHVPGIGFVNEFKLQVAGERDARVALLQMWLDAGMALGNHTYSHPYFQRTPLSQFEDETIRGEVVTRALLAAAGQKETYFRHPFLNTGPTAEAKAAFEEFLKQRGYRVAPVTVDNSDWMFNDVLYAARKKNDTESAALAEHDYLDYLDVVFVYFENVSRSLFGREIAQVLLIHDSALNAECLDGLLTKLEKRGYKFVSLDEALADPAYATPDLYIGEEGFSWLTRWKLAFGQKADYQNDPDPPKWIIKMSNEARKANAN